MAKVSYETDESGIAVLTLNNPPLNAVDAELLRDLEACVKRIDQDKNVKVVIVTGAGSIFMAGADITVIREINSYDEGVNATSTAQMILNDIENSRKPYIAAINGLALGGGTELSLACHMRIAGDQAQMGLPEIRLGIIPGFGGTQRSSRLLGTARALEIMLTGKFIDMKEADRIGLVNRVVSQAELMEQAKKLAGSIASKGQVAVHSIMEAAVEGSQKTLAEGLKLESRLFGRICETEDKKEGITAFLEKRKPAFKDR